MINMECCTEDVFNSLPSVQSPSYNDIAKKLLNEKFILTALELHAELCEIGTELPILKDYFGNANNFDIQNVKPEPSCISSIIRSSSQATLDSLDMTRYSEDSSGTDERVAILEFELRKAKENISSLRANLTVIAESESTSSNRITDKLKLINSPIKPHEQRALNFLINEYLLIQSYKLTSITFNDENENQDFENWHDVGLNVPKPSDLLQIYREYCRKNNYNKPSCVDASVQVDFNDMLIDTNELCQQQIHRASNIDINKDKLECTRRQTEHLEGNVFDVEDHEGINMNEDVMFDDNNEIIDTSQTNESDEVKAIESLQQETSISTRDIEEEKDSSSAVISFIGDTSDTDDPSEKDQIKFKSCETHMTTISTSNFDNLHAQHIPELFKKEVLNYSSIDTHINNDDDTIDYSFYNYDGTLESLIDILSKILPTFVPYIALNKRDHVIPLILNTIRFNSDTMKREKLLQLLFNLKKKPDEIERGRLLKGLVSSVQIKDNPIKPEEIITVCWEQSQHRYSERRLLAIECCSVLAPYTSSAIKNSLMISMLQQILLEDKKPIVRVAVIRTLALLVAFNDDPDKYFQCEELALAALDDESSQVFDIASTLLLPTLAQWALSLNRLLSHLFTRIIDKLKNLMKQNTQLNYSGNNYHSNERAIRLINVLQILLPHMIVCIVNNSTVKCQINDNTPVELPEKLLKLFQSEITNPVIFVDSNENITKIINTFLTNNWDNIWPELEWLYTKLFPDIVIMLKSLNTSQECLLNYLLMYIESLCNGFGHYVVLYGIKTIFNCEIMELEKQLINLYNNETKLNINLTLIPAYMLILSTINITELLNNLKHFIIIISNSEIDITCLIITIRLLLKQCDIIEKIIAVLWDCVVHQSANVRCTIATLFGNIIGNLSEQIVTARVAPAIITLASDSDINVKANAVTALGKLINDCSSNEAKDKGRLTLESIIMEIDSNNIPQILSIPLISTLANTAQNSPQRYIDIVAVQLSKISALAVQYNENVELTIALLDAYSILIYCPINNQCIINVILPGLRYLQSLINQQLPHRNDSVDSLIQEVESRLNPIKSIDRTSVANAGLSLSLKAANVGQGVEDMRQRMTKIFTPSKSSSSNIPSIFRKK